MNLPSSSTRHSWADDRLVSGPRSREPQEPNSQRGTWSPLAFVLCPGDHTPLFPAARSWLGAGVVEDGRAGVTINQTTLINVFVQLFPLPQVCPGGQLVLRGPHFAGPACRSTRASE